MDRKINIWSSQYNYTYGDGINKQLHLPYSIGCLVAYLRGTSLSEHIVLNKTYVDRADYKNKVEIAHEDGSFFDKFPNVRNDLNIFLGSTYVWNEQITFDTARDLSNAIPDLFVILGGPQIPYIPTEYWRFSNDIQNIKNLLLVHSEGEIRLFKLIWKLWKWRLGELDIKTCMTEICGMEGVSSFSGWATKLNEKETFERLKQLDSLPSPYLSGAISEIVDLERADLKWTATYETNRGCPYFCTFCDFGENFYNKLSNFDISRLIGEITWFSDNKIVYIDCADANFGIEKKDLLLAKVMANVSNLSGFPVTFRQSWAKNSSSKIIPIAKELQRGGLLTGVGLAVESLDDTTLKAIHRKNMKFDSFLELVDSFNKEDIPVYTEVIRGLPGETLDSFINGLDILMQSKIPAMSIYNCSVLCNTPMAHKSYIEKYGIKTVSSPINLAHASIDYAEMHEHENIVISTSTATEEDIRQMHIYSWGTLLFWNLGIADFIIQYYNEKYKIKHIDVVGAIIDYCKDRTSDDHIQNIFNTIYGDAIIYTHDGMTSKGWHGKYNSAGNVNWPIEEKSWLCLMETDYEFWDGANQEFLLKFYDHIVAFIDYKLLGHHLSLDHSERHELIKKQYNSLVKFDGGNFYEYAKEMIWYGRRSGKFRHYRAQK